MSLTDPTPSSYGANTKSLGPLRTIVLAESTTGVGTPVEITGQDDPGAIQVQGLSQDTITVECDAGKGPGTVAEIEENGWTSLTVVPFGTYSLTRSGNTDSITVLLQI
jgi:hypothetical protein